MSTVLILGALSDIGLAIAEKYASCGSDIQLAARHPERLYAVCQDLRIRFGVGCQPYAFDALDTASHGRFFNQLSVKPDIVICVFGYMQENAEVMRSTDEILKTIDTNFTGAVTALSLISTHFCERGHGQIAGISSVAGIRGRQSNFIYGSSKAGFSAFLSGLRNYCTSRNVHVMTVLPGFVYTKMTEQLNLPALLTATPEQVADAVFNGLRRERNVIYVKPVWRLIMMVIRLIPEFIFKKMKL